MFMQPGGKPEPGEDAAAALERELFEELGVRVDASHLAPLGTHTAAAANEPGFEVRAEVFALELTPDDVHVAAEIAQARWITPNEAADLPLAPLTRDILLPMLWA